MRFAGWLGMIVGIMMLGQWGLLLSSGQVPEVQTEPIRLAFHLAGEFSAAFALIGSGYGLLKGLRWAKNVFLVSAGMVLYSEIVSPGYFAQQGQWNLVAMFGVLIVLTVTGIVRLNQKRKELGVN